ncbi:MAG: trans-aconitate 2-methyltransferase [Planctomycetota bacterium]
MTGARELRSCFDEVADLYASTRPGYPPELVHALLARAPAPAHVLEVGCGTGQLTRDLLGRGLTIHALELGPRLAARARADLAGHPELTVEVADFETWTPPRRYDLLVSAQAFHWIDPTVGLARAAAALRPGGALALLWTVDRSEDTPLYRATSPVYARYPVAAGPPLALPVNVLPPSRARSARTEGARRKRSVERSSTSAPANRYPELLAACPDFDPLERIALPWEHTYTQDEWLAQVRTFSSTRALEPEARREGFLAELAAAIAAAGGVVPRRYESVLLLARRA